MQLRPRATNVNISADLCAEFLADFVVVFVIYLFIFRVTKVLFQVFKEKLLPYNINYQLRFNLTFLSGIDRLMAHQSTYNYFFRAPSI